MVTIEQLKEDLGPAAEGLSDKQLEEINGILERIADAIFDMWLRDRAKSRSTQRDAAASDIV